MRYTSIGLGLLGGVLFLGAARAADPVETSNPAKTAPSSQPVAVEALPPGDYVGRLVSVDATGTALVLQLNTSRRVLKNPDGPTRTFDQIVQDVGKDELKVGQAIQDAVISRSPADYERKRQAADKAVTKFQLGLPKQLVQFQRQLDNPQPVEYVTLTERKDVTMKTAKAVKVRVRDLPAIDADGRVRQYTADEIKQAKGAEPYQPGFDGKLADLKAGTYVRVTVARQLPVEAKVNPGASEAKPVAGGTEITTIAVIGKEQLEKADAGRP